MGDTAHVDIALACAGDYAYPFSSAAQCAHHACYTAPECVAGSLTGVMYQRERSSWQADVTEREQGGGGLEGVLRLQDGHCWAVRCVIDGREPQGVLKGGGGREELDSVVVKTGANDDTHRHEARSVKDDHLVLRAECTRHATKLSPSTHFPSDTKTMTQDGSSFLCERSLLRPLQAIVIRALHCTFLTIYTSTQALYPNYLACLTQCADVQVMVQ